MGRHPSEILRETCEKCLGKIKAGFSLLTGACIALVPSQRKDKDECRQAAVRKIRSKAGFSGMRGTERLEH